jgi:uncharacterized protein YqjF (DUF2071 family)
MGSKPGLSPAPATTTTPRRPFLTAIWSNLTLVTYAVPPSLLQSTLPSGLTLEVRDGNAFVSLVAFDFLETRVMRVAWPGFVNFPELNLRTYVRQDDRRGVLFIREYVPSGVVASMARTLYNEPYQAADMTSQINETAESVTADRLITLGGNRYRCRVRGVKPPATPPADSLEHFFKEHEWGFGRDRRGQTLRYHVEHPVWATYPVDSYDIDIGWEKLYGAQWKFLQDVEPYSVIFAIGSSVKVYPKERHAAD